MSDGCWLFADVPSDGDTPSYLTDRRVVVDRLTAVQLRF